MQMCTTTERRIGPLETRQPLNVVVDGQPVTAFAGESVATVLLALGRYGFRHTEHGAPRGLFCGMGVCFDFQRRSSPGGAQERLRRVPPNAGLLVDPKVTHALVVTGIEVVGPAQSSRLGSRHPGVQNVPV